MEWDKEEYMRNFWMLVGYAGAVVCVVGGIYLLAGSLGGESSILQVIARAMGVYFIGKGLFVASNTALLAKGG